MKLWASVRLGDSWNAQKLIMAFFEEFNQDSSITIKGKEAQVEIVFENSPPKETIRAIANCKVDYFKYGKDFKDHEPTELEQEEIGEISELPEPTEQSTEEGKASETDEEESDSVEQLTEEEEASETHEEEPRPTEQRLEEEKNPQQAEQPKKKRGKQSVKEEDLKALNTKLEEIAKLSTSFDGFVKSVAEWLELGKRQQFFIELVFASTAIRKLSWKKLEDRLAEKRVSYTVTDKLRTAGQVNQKLSNSSVTILPFLSAMAKYETYSFEQKQSEEENTEPATEEIVEEESVRPEETTAEDEVKEDLIYGIPHFEEVFGNVDKAQSIEDRVRFVLTTMGLEKVNPEYQNQIFEIANKAVRMKEFNLEVDLFASEGSSIVRMVFSEFINEFVSKHYQSANKVKLSDFLKQLQRIVMYKHEIES